MKMAKEFMSMRKVWLIMTLAVGLMSCGEEPPTQPDDQTPVNPEPPVKSLTFEFTNAWNGLPVNMHSSGHINQAGNDLQPSLIDYLIANIYLIDDNGMRHDLDSVWGYISQTRRLKSFTADIEGWEGSFQKIGFEMGLDSLTNHGDPFAFPPDHALDPMYGMHWSWASGYIFFKFEGRYNDDQGDNSAFAYHIAGLENRTPFELPIELNLDSDSTVIHFQTDIYEMFDNPHFYDLNIDGAFSHSTNDNGVVEKLRENMMDFISVSNVEYFED